MKICIALFIILLNAVYAVKAADITLSAEQAVARALNYNNSMIQLNQKMNAAQLKYEDFYRNKFNYNLSLKSSASRTKDLTYSYYEYMYDTESTKSSLQDSDSLKSSIELEISKQFKYSTQASFYSNISTSSSLSTTDKGGDFSDTTLDQYSTYDTRSFVYNPEIGLKLTHYLLGKDPDTLKKSVKNEEHKVEQAELSNFLKS